MTRSLFSLALVCALISGGLAAQAPDRRSLPRRLAAAVPHDATLVSADTINASPVLRDVQIVRATAFRCFDCPYVHLALASRGARTVLLLAPRDLERLWPFVSPDAVRGWPLRDVVRAVFDATCIPDCQLHVLNSMADKGAAAVMFSPRDSLPAIHPPIDRIAEDSTEATSFFVGSASQIFRIVARGRVGAPIRLVVTQLAGVSP